MMRHQTEARLNDYVDGLLAEPDRLEVEAHLAECVDCRRAVDGLRSLIRQAAELPAIAPSRDLLPGIRRATAPRSFTAHRWGALAASLLVVAAAAVGFVMMRQGTEPGPPSASVARTRTASSDDAMAELRKAEMEFAQAARVLLETLEARRDELPTEALAALETNLALIDQSIDDVRSSLENGGFDAQTERALATLYHQKMQLLWKASRLSS